MTKGDIWQDFYNGVDSPVQPTTDDLVNVRQEDIEQMSGEGEKTHIKLWYVFVGMIVLIIVFGLN